MNILLSIVCVTKDNVEDLKKTLSSIDELIKNENTELIIINAGEELDASVLHYVPTRANLTLVQENDDGIYDGMNKGARCSIGKYIWFLNSGDTFARSIEDEKLMAMLYHNYDLLVFAHKTNQADNIKYPKKLSVTNLFIYVTSIFNHQSIIIKKSIMKKFDLRYTYKAEYDSYFNILKCNPTVMYQNKPLAEFALGGVGKKYKLKVICEIFQIQFKNSYYRSLLSIPFILKLVFS